jgi:hypothetical protein
MSKQSAKTFEEMGIKFTTEGDCKGCLNDRCFNTVPSTFDDSEYHVHISTNAYRTHFHIHCNINSSTDSKSDIEADFNVEHAAVRFVCKNFNWFKCFNS